MDRGVSARRPGARTWAPAPCGRGLTAPGALGGAPESRGPARTSRPGGGRALVRPCRPEGAAPRAPRGGSWASTPRPTRGPREAAGAPRPHARGGPGRRPTPSAGPRGSLHSRRSRRGLRPGRPRGRGPRPDHSSTRRRKWPPWRNRSRDPRLARSRPLSRSRCPLRSGTARPRGPASLAPGLRTGAAPRPRSGVDGPLPLNLFRNGEADRPVRCGTSMRRPPARRHRGDPAGKAEGMAAARARSGPSRSLGEAVRSGPR